MKRERDGETVISYDVQLKSARKSQEAKCERKRKSFKWLDCIKFIPVRTLEDITNPKKRFAPLFIHQFFPYDEEISGLSQLFVSLFYTVDGLDIYITIDAERDGNLPILIGSNNFSAFNGMRDDEFSDKHDGYKEMILNYVIQRFSKVRFSGPFHTLSSTFSNLVTSTSHVFTGFGKLVYEFPLDKLNDLNKEVIQIRFFNAKDAENKDGFFSHYHLRVEWFMHFFLDACSNIEWDKNWNVYLIFKVNNETHVEFVGLLSYYKFFCLPKLRARISQFMLLPPFHGKDIGIRSLRYVYGVLLGDETIGEITVENPADSFSQMQDVLCVLIAADLGLVQPCDLMGSTGETGKNESLNVEKFLCKDFLRTLRIKLKKNLTQNIRTAIIISLALVIPASDKEIFRKTDTSGDNQDLHSAWRQTQYSLWCPKDFFLSKTCKAVRVFVKRRIRHAHYEILKNLSTDEQRVALSTYWNEEYNNYYRSVGCVRRLLQLNIWNIVNLSYNK